MKFKDYLFYRMYWVYKKDGDFGRFNAVLYLTFIEMLSFSPFIFFIIGFFQMEDAYARPLFIIYPCSITIFNFCRYYNKKRFLHILDKYKGNKYNKRIKKWMLYSLGLMAVCALIIGLVIVKQVILYFIDIGWVVKQ